MIKQIVTKEEKQLFRQAIKEELKSGMIRCLKKE